MATAKKSKKKATKKAHAQKQPKPKPTPKKKKKATAKPHAKPIATKRNGAKKAAKVRSQAKPKKTAAAKHAQARPTSKAKRKLRRNPSIDEAEEEAEELDEEEADLEAELQDALALYKEFRGKEATRAHRHDYPMGTPAALMTCGRLQQLAVRLTAGDQRGGLVILSFHTSHVKACATGDGGSLYFAGGNQALDLPGLGLTGSLPKDHIEVGRAEEIAYYSTKDFHDFEPCNYVHQFGEDRGQPPLVIYDTQARRTYLVGGSYRVERAGIVN